MNEKKQIFYDHKELESNHLKHSETNIKKSALWGILEFGSEFHVPFGYPLTKEAVEELNKTLKKDDEELKK